MSSFVKIIVALVLIGLMFITFWIVEYQPKQAEIVKLQNDIQNQKDAYARLEIESQNLAKWELAKLEFENALGKLHQTASVKDFIPSFLKDIERLVKEERISTGDPTFAVVSITPGTVVQPPPPPVSPATSGKEEKKDEKSSASAPPPPPPAPLVQGGKTVVQLNFTGRYNTIIDFLQQLSNFKLNKLVTIDKISLSPSGEGKGGSPTLTVGMPFVVYMMGGE